MKSANFSTTKQNGHTQATYRLLHMMAYSGSCPDMCPEKERQARFGLYMSIFERDRDNQPNELAMIKEYRRSGADQDEPLPEDLRTPRALQLTIDYLAGNIMDDSRSTSQELSLEWYDFLWDRLRAVRKDITQQNMCDQAAAILVERCARFHVHSSYAMNRVNNFDVDMNKRNLNDCLQMLRQMYTDLKQKDAILCPGELEFQKYDILLHLNEDHLSSNVLMKTSDHRKSSDMKFIIRVFNAYTNNNYYKFFQLMEQADYMTSCLLSLYANKMRLVGMKMIAVSSTSRQSSLYPTDLIINTLGLDGPDDLYSFASALGVDVQDKDSKSCLVLTKELISRLRRSDITLPPFKSFRLVESKMRNCSVGQLVYGPTELSNEVCDEQMDVIELPVGTPAPIIKQDNELKPMHVATSPFQFGLPSPPGEVRFEPISFGIDRPTVAPDELPTKVEPGLVQPFNVGGGLEKIRLPQLTRNTKPLVEPNPVLDVNETGGRAGPIDWLKDREPARKRSYQHIELKSLPDGGKKLHMNKSRPRKPPQIAEPEPAKLSFVEAPAQSPIKAVPPIEEQFKPHVLSTIEEVVAAPGGSKLDILVATDEATPVKETTDDQAVGNMVAEDDDDDGSEADTLGDFAVHIKPPRKRQEIADMMPVGKFKKRVFSSKINIRRSPEPPVTSLPKRMKPNEKRDILNSISMQIKVEDNVNKLFSQLASMTTTSR